MNTLLSFFDTAGIYCPLLSLKSKYDAGCGDIESASYFIDFLHKASWNVWKCGNLFDGFGIDLSIINISSIPYVSLSSMEGYMKKHTSLLHQNKIIEKKHIIAWKKEILRIAFATFLRDEYHLHTDEAKEFQDFCNAEYAWLDTYALQTVAGWIYKKNEGLHNEQKETIQYEHAQEILFVKFIQWIAQKQLHSLYNIAHEKTVALCPEIELRLDRIQNTKDIDQYIHYIERITRYADGVFIHFIKEQTDMHLSHAALMCIREIANIMDRYCFPIYIDNYGSYKGILEELGFAKQLTLQQAQKASSTIYQSYTYNGGRIALNNMDEQEIWNNIKKVLDCGVKTAFFDMRDIISNGSDKSSLFRMDKDCEELLTDNHAITKLYSYAQLSQRNTFDRRDTPRFFSYAKEITRYMGKNEKPVISVFTKDSKNYKLNSSKNQYIPKQISGDLYQFTPHSIAAHTTTLQLTYQEKNCMRLKLLYS